MVPEHEWPPVQHVYETFCDGKKILEAVLEWGLSGTPATVGTTFSSGLTLEDQIIFFINIRDITKKRQADIVFWLIDKALTGVFFFNDLFLFLAYNVPWWGRWALNS